MESLERKVSEQAMEISDLKNELFMLKMELQTLALNIKLNSIDIKGLNKRHESLFNFTLNQGKSNNNQTI